MCAVTEALEASWWLKTAGFPQYVQLFEGEWRAGRVCLDMPASTRGAGSFAMYTVFPLRVVLSRVELRIL